MFSDSRDRMIILSDSRNTIFESRDPNKVLRTPKNDLSCPFVVSAVLPF